MPGWNLTYLCSQKYFMSWEHHISYLACCIQRDRSMFTKSLIQIHPKWPGGYMLVSDPEMVWWNYHVFEFEIRPVCVRLIYKTFLGCLSDCFCLGVLFCSVHIQVSFGVYENQRQGLLVPCLVEDTWPAGRGRSATTALPLYVCSELFASGHWSQFCAMLKEMSKTGHKTRNLLTFQIVLWQNFSQTFNLSM